MSTCVNCGKPLTSKIAECTFCAKEFDKVKSTKPKPNNLPNSTLYLFLLFILGVSALLRTAQHVTFYVAPILFLGKLPWHLGSWVQFFGDPSPIGTASSLFQNFTFLISGLLATLTIRRLFIVLSTGEFRCPSTFADFPKMLYSFGLIMIGICFLLFIGKIMGGYVALPGMLFLELSMSLTKTILFISLMLAELIDLLKSKPST